MWHEFDGWVTVLGVGPSGVLSGGEEDHDREEEALRVSHSIWRVALSLWLVLGVRSSSQRLLNVSYDAPLTLSHPLPLSTGCSWA